MYWDFMREKYINISKCYLKNEKKKKKRTTTQSITQITKIEQFSIKREKAQWYRIENSSVFQKVNSRFNGITRDRTMRRILCCNGYNWKSWKTDEGLGIVEDLAGSLNFPDLFAEYLQRFRACRNFLVELLSRSTCRTTILIVALVPWESKKTSR